MEAPQVLVVGGTGFIGYHVCRELLGKGYHVTALTIDDVPDNYLPGVKIIKADYRDMADLQLTILLTDIKYLIFAAGADDRVTPTGDATEFFHQANVVQLERILKVAKAQGVKRVTVLNSYFAYFHRLWPQMRLAQIHPYIKSRVEQQQMAFAVGGIDMPVAIIEIPYVVGVTPGKGSLWKGLVKYVNSRLPLKFYTGGGTAVISVRNLAQAIANSLVLTTDSAMYQVADVNMTWPQWLSSLQTDPQHKLAVVTLPKTVIKVGMLLLKVVHTLLRKQSGLNPVKFVELQTQLTFLPVEECRRKLQYGTYDISEDFADTIKLCLSN